MATSKIQATKNYAMFQRSADNRPAELKKHKKLLESMKLYGFLKCFPIVCYRENGHWVIKDGQHRKMVAELLGLTVFWIEEDVNFDVAVVNCTAKIWQLRDYAQMFANKGHQAYREGIEFAETYRLPLGTAFSLLAGTTSFGNVQEQFVAGDFKVKERSYAERVAVLYGSIVVMAPELKKAAFVDACMAVCRVEGFDAKRLIGGAKMCREKLVNYGTRDAYLDMLEAAYNYKRTAKHLVPLKIQAIAVMRERNKGSAKVPRETAG